MNKHINPSEFYFYVYFQAVKEDERMISLQAKGSHQVISFFPGTSFSSQSFPGMLSMDIGKNAQVCIEFYCIPTNKWGFHSILIVSFTLDAVFHAI